MALPFDNGRELGALLDLMLRGCGIANVGIAGRTPADLADALLTRCKVYTVAIDAVPVKGVRITPHLYTTTTDLDAFVKAIGDVARG